jgi:hypothetical protein
MELVSNRVKCGEFWGIEAGLLTVMVSFAKKFFKTIVKKSYNKI